MTMYDIRCDECGQPVTAHTSAAGGRLVCPRPGDVTVIEGRTWKWVKVSTELLAQLGDWSEPVRVKIVDDRDGVLDMVFERVTP